MEKAIYTDCRKLIDNFENFNNTRFDYFCKEWKNMCFYHIYSGQTQDIQIVQTTMACMCIGTNILCKDRNILRKIGALYLLYSVYYKQPTLLFVKIDVTLDSWKQIKAFIASLEDHGNTDQAKYIFWKLVQDNAFRFVFTDTYYGLERFTNPYAKYSDNNVDNVPLDALLGNDIRELTDEESGFLSAFAVLEDGYNEMKELMNADEVPEGPSTSKTPLPISNLLKDIKSSITSIGKILKPKSKPESAAKLTDTSIKARRESIRKKALWNLTKPTIKHEIVKDEPDATTSEIAVPRRARNNNLRQSLPKESLAELERDEASDSDSM